MRQKARLLFGVGFHFGGDDAAAAIEAVGADVVAQMGFAGRGLDGQRLRGQGVVGAAHAGWKGALAGVVEAAVVAMEGEGARRERMVAVVGPCIGVASYEVGLEFLARFVSEDPSAGAFFHPGASDDKRRFDLTGYVLSRISRSGVGQADALGLDTYGEERFFSNRRAVHRQESDYGRLLSAIMLV